VNQQVFGEPVVAAPLSVSKGHRLTETASDGERGFAGSSRLRGCGDPSPGSLRIIGGRGDQVAEQPGLAGRRHRLKGAASKHDPIVAKANVAQIEIKRHHASCCRLPQPGRRQLTGDGVAVDGRLRRALAVAVKRVGDHGSIDPFERQHTRGAVIPIAPWRVERASGQRVFEQPGPRRRLLDLVEPVSERERVIVDRGGDVFYRRVEPRRKQGQERQVGTEQLVRVRPDDRDDDLRARHHPRIVLLGPRGQRACGLIEGHESGLRPVAELTGNPRLRGR
jgi:hypothetical protein